MTGAAAREPVVHRSLALACLLAALAGALATLSLPPYGVWPVLLISYPVLVWLLDGAGARRSFPRGFAIGWCFAFGYFVPSLWWISEAFWVEPEKFAALIPFAVAGLPSYLALYWGAACGLAARLWSTGFSRLLLLSCLLAAGEWLRGNMLTGFPWNLPGYAAGPFDGFSQLASIGGIYSLTAIVLLLAMAPAVLWQYGSWAPRRPSFVLVAVLYTAAIGAHLWGNQRIAAYEVAGAQAAGQSRQVRIVQPSIPQNRKWDRDARQQIVDTYLAMTAQGWPAAVAEPPLVFWPESALPLLLAEEDQLRGRIAGLLPEGSMLFTGGLHRVTGSDGTAQIFNSLLLIGPGGAIRGRHDKVRLVPFGEFLPFSFLLEPLGIRQLANLPQGFAGGTEEGVVAVAGAPSFAGFICYEAVFPRSWPYPVQPNLLVNVTNDAWFGVSGGPHQHLAQARFRAIEQGVPMVRAANTGISAIVNAVGRITGSLPLQEKAILEAKLPPVLGQTAYGRFGDMLFVGLLLSFVTAILICRLNNL